MTKLILTLTVLAFLVPGVVADDGADGSDDVLPELVPECLTGPGRSCNLTVSNDDPCRQMRLDPWNEGPHDHKDRVLLCWRALVE